MVSIISLLPDFYFFSLILISKGWIAQLVEQRTENPRVAGSIPAPAIFFSYEEKF